MLITVSFPELSARSFRARAVIFCREFIQELIFTKIARRAIENLYSIVLINPNPVLTER
jgi:hypothetical protein